MHFFTPNHVALVAACYPPWSALPSTAPEYRPNAQELSRLTYYATNRPGKIHKLGAELEKHTRSECTKTIAGNARARAYASPFSPSLPADPPSSSLLITLAIIRALAIECRRDISLLSPALLSCLKITLNLVSADLEITARAASVVRISPHHVTHSPHPHSPQLTAWCTFTDGHAIGVDAELTQNYLVVLGHFANQSTAEIKSVDYELRNRYVHPHPSPLPFPTLYPGRVWSALPQSPASSTRKLYMFLPPSSSHRHLESSAPSYFISCIQKQGPSMNGTYIRQATDVVPLTLLNVQHPGRHGQYTVCLHGRIPYPSP